MRYICWYGIREYGKTTECGMVCVDGMRGEKHSIWYVTFVVWYHGTMSWMYFMAKFAWWFGMFQYIRSVRVEYVVRIPSVTSLYIGHWKVFESIALRTDRQICIYKVQPAADHQRQHLLCRKKNKCGAEQFHIVPGTRYMIKIMKIRKHVNSHQL